MILKYNGLFDYNQLKSNGFNQRQINNMEKNGDIQKVGHGLYCHKNYTPDTFKILQWNNSFIYSHETAAYLHDLTNRFPRIFTGTIPSGYHYRKKTNLQLYYIKSELFNIGVVDFIDYEGNLIQIYDKERTICDLLRSKNKIEQQVLIESLQNYFYKKPNLRKLIKYSKLFHLESEIKLYCEILMKG